ncbi:MAG: hypothetical protein R3C28_05220 [Pirellulaceae bacterium]
MSFRFTPATNRMLRISLPLILASYFVSLVSGEVVHQSADLGYRFLTEKAYLPPDFDEETFNATWQVWPEPLRSRAAEATPSERRRLAFERYGLTFRLW